MTPDSERLHLPGMDRPAPPPSFPLVASLAPVAIAVVLWLVTSSPFALAFALLGPIVAVAGRVDARRTARRFRRQAVADAARRLDEFGGRVDAWLAARRSRLEAEAEADRGWERRDHPSGDARWRLGTADVPSGLELVGNELDEVAELSPRVEELRRRAAVLSCAPVVVSLGDELTVTGSPSAVAAFARALVLQAAARCEPAAGLVRVPEGEWWARVLPHRVEHAPCWEVRDEGRLVMRVRVGDPEPGGSSAPRLSVGDETGRAPSFEGAPRLTRLSPALMSAAEASHRAQELADRARRGGWRPSAALPARVELGALLELPREPGGLAAVVGVDSAGPVVLDLDTDGPHALVAGTTGSGKSELLVSWVLALAATHSPRELVFLLIDFKGGAAFAPLVSLPHVVGMVSDLDQDAAARAVTSLRAELRRREAVLASHGVRSVGELPSGVLPRLVIVVDEFAALSSFDGELAAVFADLSARGRSLGLHLVLCTQRPSGVVRDAVLANVTLRICLRVLDRADSVAVVGAAGAAEIPATARGRAVLRDSRAAREVQFALASESEVAAIRAHWPDGPAADARPWQDPLPAMLPVGSLPDASHGGTVIGAVDRPAEQRRDALELDLWGSGALLVVGATGSGRTAALVTVAQLVDAELRWVPDDPSELWQALATPAGERRVLVVADDLDRTLASCDSEQRAALAELIANGIRDTSRTGIALAASARAVGATMLPIAACFEQRLLLRMPSREDHLLAGGESASYRAARRPGSAIWRGHEAQLGWSASPPPERWEAVLQTARLSSGRWAVVTPRPSEWTERLASAGVDAAALDAAEASTAVVVGDPDGWLGDYLRLGEVRRAGRMLLVECTSADHRALTRLRAPLPPLGSRDDEGWLVERGTTTRVVVVAG